MDWKTLYTHLASGMFNSSMCWLKGLWNTSSISYLCYLLFYNMNMDMLSILQIKYQPVNSTLIKMIHLASWNVTATSFDTDTLGHMSHVHYMCDTYVIYMCSVFVLLYYYTYPSYTCNNVQNTCNIHVLQDNKVYSLQTCRTACIIQMYIQHMYYICKNTSVIHV